MGRPKKDPAHVRDIPVNFRVSQPVKATIDELARRYAAESLDDSLTGWFMAMVGREARAAGITVEMGGRTEASEPKPAPPSKAKPTRRKAVDRSVPRS